MATRNLSKLILFLHRVADDLAGTTLITVAAYTYIFERRHPRAAAVIREGLEGARAGFAWGSAYCGDPFAPRRNTERDPSWDAVMVRTLRRAGQLRPKGTDVN